MKRRLTPGAAALCLLALLGQGFSSVSFFDVPTGELIQNVVSPLR